LFRQNALIVWNVVHAPSLASKICRCWLLAWAAIPRPSLCFGHAATSVIQGSPASPAGLSFCTRPNSSKTTSRRRIGNSCGCSGHVGAGVVRACECEGCNDDSEHNTAADDPRYEEFVVSFVPSEVALVGHGCQP